MARFYGCIQGNRGVATRMGTPKSGFGAHIRGWNIGVRVECCVDSDGNDVIVVTETGGSNNPFAVREIARLRPRTSKPEEEI